MLKTAFITILLTISASTASAQSADAVINDFARFYAQMDAADTSFSPANPSREARVEFLAKVVRAYCSPVVAMKRASSTRPISDEVVVYVAPGGEYRLFRDFIRDSGASNFEILLHGDLEHLPTDQPLVNPITLGRLAENVSVPLASACSTAPAPAPQPAPVPSPAPSPTPSLDLGPVVAALARLEAQLGVLEIRLSEVQTRLGSVADRVETLLTSNDRIVRQLLSPPDMVGSVFGRGITLRPVVKPVTP